MTNGEKFKEVFGFGADGSRVIAVNAIWWDCEFQDSKPFTNADRIRAMSDEELSNFTHSLKNKCGDCPVAKSNVFCSTFPTCKDAWLAWLRQEVNK